MFTQRSNEKELLDMGPSYYTPQEFSHCQKMLFRVNKLLGTFKSTVKALKNLSKTSSLLDVGCGGGLFILHLSKYFPQMKLTGTDVSYEAIQIAQQELQHWQSAQVSFNLQSQLELTLPDNHVDIVLTTMVCHHLSDDELINFLKKIYSVTRDVVIINDLHRHALAYWLYRIISPVLFRNRLITYDGLISIRRGFTRTEWHTLLKQAGLSHYKIKWCFPFRWMVTIWKKS